MQPSHVKEEMPTIERYIDQAAQLCHISNDIPDQLRNCIGELERESNQAISMLAQEQNEKRIIDCIDHLEKLGDRAIQACRQGSNVDEQVQHAVQQVHAALSDLKHRLH